MFHISSDKNCFICNTYSFIFKFIFFSYQFKMNIFRCGSNLCVSSSSTIIRMVISPKNSNHISQLYFSTRINPIFSRKSFSNRSHSLLKTPLPNHLFQQIALLSKKRKSSNLINFTWKSFIISSIFIAIIAGVLLRIKDNKIKQIVKQKKKSLGQAAIGGSFDLIDHNGQKFTSTDLEGKWALIYFGFTHCPDICPDEMEKMVKATELIEANKSADKIQPVFISVDPERDNVNIVREYIREFSPKLIGLTGTKEQIETATKAYRIYYSAGPKDNFKDYIVDHTIITYLIDPEGQLVDYFGQTKTAEDIANTVISIMQNYRSLNRRFGFL